MAAKSIEEDYVRRTNLAIDFIVSNLDSDLTLENVAKVACFSPFHFHRVFRCLLGETLNQFVKRQRLEKALYLMSHAPGRSLTKIALDCGFSSSSDFSRSFKARFGSSPSAFDVNQFRQLRREEFDAAMAACESGADLTRLPSGENPDGFSVTVKELPARSVAYIRVLEPYRENSSAATDACQRLMDWSKLHGVFDGQWLGYQWDDPEIVALEDCRYDVAVVVDTNQLDFRAEGEIGRFAFPPMKVADVAVCGDIQKVQRAIDWLFGTWLPRSGYVPDDQPAFESWHGKPFEHGYEYFEISCQLPIVRG